MYKYPTMIIIVMLLSGCGGGSGTSSTTSTDNSDSADNEPYNSTDTTTSELKSSADFNFSNHHNISLDLQLAAFANERVMVNICLPVGSESALTTREPPSIDYSQCVFKATIATGELQIPLTIAKHEHLLILEMRPYSNFSEKTTYQWQPTDGGYWVVR
ncbi:hypothetical protein [Marinomonas balearica]|uniref:Lipoprotein n=1 Tax=Marinomonas balearica TaxID=491947 RepID=A0A4R6MJH0_9GAMM|nr:hypothetical protein [Marinomonas balearica]TDP01081.1 hypothetical protein DFP79_0233 [Marinomonas balearica]